MDSTNSEETLNEIQTESTLNVIDLIERYFNLSKIGDGFVSNLSRRIVTAAPVQAVGGSTLSLQVNAPNESGGSTKATIDLTYAGSYRISTARDSVIIGAQLVGSTTSAVLNIGGIVVASLSDSSPFLGRLYCPANTTISVYSTSSSVPYTTIQAVLL